MGDGRKKKPQDRVQSGTENRSGTESLSGPRRGLSGQARFGNQFQLVRAGLDGQRDTQAEGPDAQQTATVAQTPHVPYVDQQSGVNGKSKTLASLFAQEDTKAVLTANDYGSSDEETLAGVMGNEGGRNERRKAMFAATQKRANTLATKLTKGKIDLAQIGTAEIPEKLLKTLTAEEKAMLQAAQAGKIDLATATGTLADDATEEQKSAKKAALDGVGEYGIDRQTELYGELRTLAGKGKDATAEEKKRLKELRAMSLQGGGTMGGAEGLSDARFKELYSDTQTRFENARYKKGHAALKAWIDGGEKGDGPNVGVNKESAKDFVARHPEIRDGNYDALADIETSYGTAQIMGHHADMGKLKKNNGDEKYSMADLKASGQRLDPTATDVDLQISYFRDIAGISDPGDKSSEDIAASYNGSGWRETNPNYATKLDDNKAAYRAAKKARKPAKTP